MRAMSSALVNRVTILQVRHDVDEWLAWAQRGGVRREIRSFIATVPDALMRAGAGRPGAVLDAARRGRICRARSTWRRRPACSSNETRRALAFGRLSPEDAAVFCALAEESSGPVQPLESYIREPELLPKGDVRALVHPRLHPPVRARRPRRRLPAARDQPLPAQPVAGASADPADRHGREMGRARRRPRHVRSAAQGRPAA